MTSSRGTTPIVWLLVSLPGVALTWVLLYTVFARLGYPYDLEWMEGGLLTHAARISEGRGIYVAPSVEFVPYLYTPLYPGLLAALGQMVGVTYQLGRTISILSMLGVLALMGATIVKAADRSLKGAAWAGTAVAFGLFSATYPWVEGWYDLVRADTLFLIMALGGIAMVRAVARSGRGANGQLQVAAAATMLSLSFFAKQTGVFFVAIGGCLLLVYNWRRVPVFVAISALIGLGGTWLLNRVTGGWFWTYVFEVHQSHDFNSDRVVDSFANILWHFPVLTVAIAVTLLVVVGTAIAKRRLPPSAEPFLSWTFVFVAATVLGAISWGTQWAHFNAYVPAMTTGALAAGAGLPALVGALSQWRLPAAGPIPTPVAIGYALAGAFAWQLIATWWTPGTFIPSREDRKAGDQLIKRIASVDGEVFVPYHPWYAKLAGKRTYAHRMGLLDMSVGKKTWPVVGLREAFRNHFFAAVFLDNRPVGAELAGLSGPYRLDEFLGHELAPRVFTGAGAAYSASKLVPHSVWVPTIAMVPPADVRVIENFETGSLKEWKRSGRAWGGRAVSQPLPNQGVVSRYGGRYYASSFHGGDDSTGTLTSKEFEITGNMLTFRLSGGNSKELRVELLVDGKVVRSATGMQSERMREVVWSVAAWAGQRGRIRLVDEAKGSWGHLNVDELWLHESSGP